MHAPMDNNKSATLLQIKLDKEKESVCSRVLFSKIFLDLSQYSYFNISSCVEVPRFTLYIDFISK